MPSSSVCRIKRHLESITHVHMEGELDRSKWKPKDLIVFLNGKTTLLFREEEYEVMVKTPLILFLFRVFPEKPEVEKVHWGYLGI